MDKTQATNLIISRLQAGSDKEEIAEELSRILKAPINVTGRFVDQVVDSHPEAIPPSPQVEPTEPLPDWLESFPSPTEPELENTSPPSAESQFSNLDLPPGLQVLLNEEAPSQIQREAAPQPEPPNNFGDVLPQQAEFVPPSAASENPDSDLSPKINLEPLQAEVLKQLKKQKRFNDVVEYVCQETGWHWNKSQRLVARVKTKHHDELMAGQNRVTIIIGLGIIIVGLVMTLNGASVISDYAKLAVFARTNPEALLTMSPQVIIFALVASVTGIGMIIGGGYGVGRALTNR